MQATNYKFWNGSFVGSRQLFLSKKQVRAFIRDRALLEMWYAEILVYGTSMPPYSQLQIRGGVENNLGIIFLIFP